jgi:hypothetical protein
MQTDLTATPIELDQVLGGDDFYDFRNSPPQHGDHTHTDDDDDVFYVFGNIGIVPLRSMLDAFFAFVSH